MEKYFQSVILHFRSTNILTLHQRGLLQRPLDLYLPICSCPRIWQPSQSVWRCRTKLDNYPMLSDAAGQQQPHPFALSVYDSVLWYTMHWRRLLNLIQLF